MTKIQTGWLLDAVRHIKAQKQRPDKDRIGNYIRQHHDLTAQTVSLLLDTAVKEQILTTTITRGNTDKLTYVITGAGGTTPKSVPASHSASKKTAVSTSKAAPRVNSSADDKKTILHNKSDISLFMVQAVKGTCISVILSDGLVVQENVSLWFIVRRSSHCATPVEYRWH